MAPPILAPARKPIDVIQNLHLLSILSVVLTSGLCVMSRAIEVIGRRSVDVVRWSLVDITLISGRFVELSDVISTKVSGFWLVDFVTVVVVGKWFTDMLRDPANIVIIQSVINKSICMLGAWPLCVDPLIKFPPWSSNIVGMHIYLDWFPNLSAIDHLDDERNGEVHQWYALKNSTAAFERCSDLVCLELKWRKGQNHCY